eukprot:CAMPEP_0198133946 /NCGR_PEP_ID=MMETSP1442-20131203/59828_1 /TAXON_ID= /ORGANISM="Craspedostauros australis, Strain CCMP3328" /LENGTH=122 /DNA_ID=CAMNT_0043795081 /DNA_START=254 /DNA_END=623 /DNA_ORIENTATION=+
MIASIGALCSYMWTSCDTIPSDDSFQNTFLKSCMPFKPAFGDASKMGKVLGTAPPKHLPEELHAVKPGACETSNDGLVDWRIAFAHATAQNGFGWGCYEYDFWKPEKLQERPSRQMVTHSLA